MKTKKKSGTPDGLSTLANRLRYARKLKGLNQDEIARMAGTTQQVISQIETGKIKKPREIMAIAAAVGQSPGWLQFGIKEIDNLDREAILLAVTLQTLPASIKEAIKTMILEAAKPKK